MKKGDNLNWNIVSLQVKEIYDRLNIDFTPFFIEATQLFKNKGYKNILDIGCGYGKNSIYLAHDGFNVTSIDTSLQALKWLKDYRNDKSIDNINIIEADMNSLPFKENTFDIVLCSSVLHHQTFNQINNSMNEIRSVLKNGGYFLFDILSIEDDSYGLGEEIEKNTFIGSREGEEDIPHHYTDDGELKVLLEYFTIVEMLKNEYQIMYNNDKIISKVFDVLAIKS